MIFGTRKSTMVTPEQALPGRPARPFDVPATHAVLGTQYLSAVYWTTPEQQAAYESTRAAYQAALTERRFGDITTEGRPASDAGPFYYAEEYHQQYLHKVPWGYCPDHGTGVACPVDFAARVKLQG